MIPVGEKEEKGAESLASGAPLLRPVMAAAGEWGFGFKFWVFGMWGLSRGLEGQQAKRV